MFFDAVKSTWLVLASRIQGVELIKGFVVNIGLLLNVNAQLIELLILPS